MLWLVLIGLISSVLGLYLSQNPAMQGLDEAGYNLLFKTRATTLEKVPDVVVVMIDEKAYEAEFGYYDPLPRAYIARLIDTLKAKGAKTIALDFAFYDKLDQLDAKGDSALQRSMKRAGNVIAVNIWHPQPDGETKMQQPHAFFRSALKGVGYANLQSAGGRINIREVKPIATMSDGETFLSFSSLAYCVTMGIGSDVFVDEIKNKKWSLISRIPLTRDGNMIINYVGGPSTWYKQQDGSWAQESEGKIVTYRSSKLTGDVAWPADFFKDKIVFVGNGSEFVPDRFVTPFYDKNKANLMYGAEVHANSFLTLFNKSYIERASILVIFLACLIFSTVMIWVTVKFGFVGEFSILALLLILIWGPAAYLFDMGVAFPVNSMTISLLFAYFTTSVYQAFTEERNKKQIKSMFARYAPPAYVDQLADDPSKLELGGEEKEISILFSDIEGFTTISENISPKQLIELLNDYLGEMTRLIFNQGGTLDKYIGDAIVAVFGAPMPQNEHALHACFAALEMQEKLVDFRAKWTERGLPPIRNRIGVNTGKVVFGNIGSEIRYDYTGIGDNMNLASRLEAANKNYGTYLMISEFTYNQVRERVIVRELDLLVVKGKSKPVKIFELLGRANEPLPEETRKLVEYYSEGIKKYRQRKWDEAIQKFEQALTCVHTDEPSKLYIQRCKKFIQAPPDESWDGTFHMTTK